MFSTHKNKLVSFFLVVYTALSVGCSYGENLKTDAVVNAPTQEKPQINSSDQTPIYKAISSTPANLPVSASLQCANEQVCRIVGSEQIWSTMNGGKAWEMLPLPKLAGEEPLSLSFFSEKDGIGWGAKGYFLTRDGGRTWVKGHQTPFESFDGRLDTVLVRENILWAGGGHYRKLKKGEGLGSDYSNYSLDRNSVLMPALYYSHDDGQTWKKILFPSDYGTVESLSFYTSTFGFASCAGLVYHTENAGKTWKLTKLLPKCVKKKYLNEYYEGSVATQFTLDALNQWIAYDDGRLTKSTDSGENWCDLLDSGEIKFKGTSRAYFLNLHFTNPKNGWALGGDNYMYVTKNGGKSWNRKDSDLLILDIEYFKEGAIILTEGGLYSFSLLD